jgi:hypothetical protein
MVVLCFIHTPCIVLNSNARFPFPTPHKSQLLSPKIWETRDQPGPGSFLQRGAFPSKSLGKRLHARKPIPLVFSCLMV